MNQKQIASLEKHIASDYDNLAGMVILQNGKTVYENYFHTCDASNRFHIYSVTKSILSILIGIALDKGYIKNIDQKVLDFFPSYPVKKGEKVIHPEVNYNRFKEITITSGDGSSVPIDMDGEFVGYAPLTLKNIPQTINFIC